MNNLINIENRRDLKKDLRTHAVISVDKEAYDIYMNTVKAKKQEKELAESRIKSLEDKVDDIMCKLNIILERVCK